MTRDDNDEMSWLIAKLWKAGDRWDRPPSAAPAGAGARPAGGA